MRKLGRKALAISLTIMVATLSFTIYYVINSGSVHHALVGCRGIDQFYTGKNFYIDWDNLVEKTANLNQRKSMIIQDPQGILDGNPHDCKSVTNAIMCLADLYNKTCKYEMTIKYFSDLSPNSGHIGIWCWDDDFQDWTRLY